MRVSLFTGMAPKQFAIPDQSSTRNLTVLHVFSDVYLKIRMFSAFPDKVGCSQQVYCTLYPTK